METQLLVRFLAAASLVFIAACGDDTAESDRLGVGAECSAAADCREAQVCLTAFKGGYCAVENCASDADCPEASACVAHDDGKNYCFRVCGSKADCNVNRSEDTESNCSSSVTFTDADANKQSKACVPPSA
ncbi:MAG: hypothetical protein ACI9WU_001283 [Myxococcota bacterium]|jgi:hypothetical protein